MTKKYMSVIVVGLLSVFLFPQAAFSANKVLAVSDQAAAKQLVEKFVRYQNTINVAGMKSLRTEKAKANWDPKKEKLTLKKAKRANGILSITKFYSVDSDVATAVVTVGIHSSKDNSEEKIDFLEFFENNSWKFVGLNDDPLAVELIPANLKDEHYFRSNDLTVDNVVSSLFDSI